MTTDTTTTTGWSTYSQTGFDVALTSTLNNGHGPAPVDGEPLMEW